MLRTVYVTVLATFLDIPFLASTSPPTLAALEHHIDIIEDTTNLHTPRHPGTYFHVSIVCGLHGAITSFGPSSFTIMDISPSVGRTRRPRTAAPGGDQTWTAAKCLRLLRPIHVRIGNLRQLAAESALATQDARPPKPTFLRTKHSLSDDEWDPSANKRARVTYAQRRRKAGRHSDPGQPSAQVPSAPRIARPAPRGPNTPGKFLITTPLIQRIKGSHVSPHPPTAESCAPCQRDTCPGANKKTGLSYLQQEIQDLKCIRAATHARHEEALLQALDALFRHAASPTAGAASRSLIAMCLRQAPRQLKRIEEWDAQEAERLGEKSALTAADAMPDMYEQMESLGGGAGWRVLRHMVRAHAIRSICDAIAEGLIDFSLTRVLVKVCIHWQCFDEATTLLESLLEQQYPEADSQDDVPSPTKKLLEPLAYFITFCTHHDRWSPLFDTLTRLIAENRVSGEWLCTKSFEPVWAGLSRRLVNGGRLCPWTLKFFHEAVRSLAWYPPAAQPESPVRTTKGLKQATPWQMFVSIVGAVTAVALMAAGRDGDGSSGICKSVLYALDGSIAKLPRRRPSQTLHYRSLLEVGIYAVSSAGDQDDRDASPTTLPTCANKNYARGAETSRRLYEGAASLICSVAQHCSRGSSLAPHQHLLTICDSMAHVSLVGRSMEDVKRDGAFILAQRTSDLRDLAFAESSLPGMGKGVSRDGSTRSAGSESDETGGGAGAATLYSGWKWDEGISEWIVRTPAPAPAPVSAHQKPCREVVALKTRFGRLGGTTADAERQTRSTRPRSIARVRPARRARAVESDDSTSEDEMAQERRGRGRPPASRASTVATGPSRGMHTKPRRKMVRKISSWGGLGSSDDELLL